MKNFILLLVITILFGCYLFLYSDRNKNVSFEKKNKYNIELYGLKNNLKPYPKTLELSYFEDDRSVSNWKIDSFAKKYIRLERSDKHSSQGKYSMEVYYGKKGVSNIKLVDFPKEWNRYRYVSFDIYSPYEEEYEFSFAVKTNYNESTSPASTYFSEHKLKQGANRFRAPVEKIAKKITMNSSQKMLLLNFYAEDKYFYLDNIRLES